MVFDDKYLCEEKYHTANLRSHIPEITEAKIC
ncbi:hypothetical protein T10_3759 [Trichinella papuae]|uniref:Uncharacterized protein n=1 Tax=Trichinella papuae TaxID=268474 RepID=A0A0V1LWK6_9BILA|nr:hypothetical protein T10_3759 [Trichinella papuae]